MPDDRRSRPAALLRRCERADVALGLALAQRKDTAEIRTLATISEVGSWQSLLILSATTAIVGVIAQDARLAAAGRRMLLAGMLASAVKTTIKRLVYRTRPNVLMDEGFYVRGRLGPNVGPWQSFPSGHCALSVAVARAVGRSYPHLRGHAYAAAGGIAVIQTLRGAHYPSDVVAGCLIGLGAEEGVNALAERRSEERMSSSRNPRTGL